MLVHKAVLELNDKIDKLEKSIKGLKEENTDIWFFKKKSADTDNTPLDKLNEIDDDDTRERLLIKSVKTLNEKISKLEEENSDKSIINYPLSTFVPTQYFKLIVLSIRLALLMIIV